MDANFTETHKRMITLISCDAADSFKLAIVAWAIIIEEGGLNFLCKRLPIHYIDYYNTKLVEKLQFNGDEGKSIENVRAFAEANNFNILVFELDQTGTIHCVNYMDKRGCDTICLFHWANDEPGRYSLIPDIHRIYKKLFLTDHNGIALFCYRCNKRFHSVKKNEYKEAYLQMKLNQHMEQCH